MFIDVAKIKIADKPEAYDLAIIDKESYPDLLVQGYTLPYVKLKGKITNLPISHKALLDAVASVENGQGKVITLIGGREVKLGDKTIRLTEVEARLFEVLLESDSYVPREVLLKSVWGDGADSGVVNVYVHYLREKLEAGGEKIILSSRREGYMIDKRFKRGEN